MRGPAYFAPSSKLFIILLSGIVVSIIRASGEERSIYMVLMESDPVAFRNGDAASEHGKGRAPNWPKAHAKQLVDSHDQLLASRLELGTYCKLYSFTHIVNGFAVHTSPSQAKKLELSEGVMLVEKDRGAKLMTTYTPQFLGLPGGAWTRTGEEKPGDGIVIGVIDTGIDPSHPSFAYDPSNPFQTDPPHFSGACEAGPRFLSTSCNGKLVSARYFAAGAAVSLPLNASVDFLSPFDAVGHGSHVASVAAGNSGTPVILNGFNYGHASGMAPHARIAVYKAIYPSGGTLADVVSAIDKAAEDGVDIIVLSIGPDEPPEDTLTVLNVFDVFLLYARRAGIFVVQAAGNKGPGAASVVSFSPWAVGVGACSTDRRYSNALILGNGRRLPAIGLSGPSSGQGTVQFRLVAAKDAVKVNGSFSSSAVEECQVPEAFDPAIVRGSIVICSFLAGFLNGISTIVAVANTAEMLGFMGFVLVANPAYGDFVAPPIPFPIPGIMIPKVSYEQILSEYYQRLIRRDPRGSVIRFGAKAAIGEGRMASFAEEAPVVSRFSSRGPDIIDKWRNLVDVLKPDVLAPGDVVWGAWSPLSATEHILAGYNFAPLSGTSMAAPHVAGIAALVKQLHPSWTPSMIASAISTTASTFDNRGEPLLAEGSDLNSLHPSTHFDHGAGFINPTAALDPGLVFSSGFEDYLVFLCSLPGIDPETIKTSTGKTCNSSVCSHPSQLNLPSITVSSLNGSLSIRRRVQNMCKKPETYWSSVQEPLGVEVSLYPPWFTIVPSQSIDLEIRLKVTDVLGSFSFGQIVLTGSLNHIVTVPLSILPVSL
ncbi:subtilisin-like protease SBT2.4 [Aristolochia californica]|uniref:subtilisin-like protease SBT2.4 n=1 Tax=Aristolochia californica TaxID=171875 RepID=UPI0035E0F7E0